MSIIAFDCDGTLFTLDNKPRHEIIMMLRGFKFLYNRIIVWSGGGKDWAQTNVDRLYLNEYVDEISFKSEEESKRLRPDICFDDEFVDLAIINIKV